MNVITTKEVFLPSSTALLMAGTTQCLIESHIYHPNLQRLICPDLETIKGLVNDCFEPALYWKM